MIGKEEKNCGIRQVINLSKKKYCIIFFNGYGYGKLTLKIYC